MALILISIVDAPEKIARAAEVIEEMIEVGLIVLSDVEFVRLAHSRTIAPA